MTSAGVAAVPRPHLRTDSAHRVRRDRPTVLLLGAMGTVASVVFWSVHTSIIDDSYITLSYARNVALHGHWGLIPQRTSNTATSPLNVLLLAVLTAVLRHPVWALGVLFVVANVVLGYALLCTVRTLDLPVRGALMAWALVLCNPLVLSAVGLEVTLAAALLGLLLMAAVEAHAWLFGLCTGLAILTRIDLAIFVLVLFATTRRLWPGRWKSLLTALAVLLPWFAFSWVALGSFVPDTLIIKTLQKSWGSYQYGNGPLLYLTIYPAATILSFLPAVLGVFALLAWTVARIHRTAPTVRRLGTIAAFGLAGVLHFLAYTRLGVPPYHWYYAPALISLSLVLALAVAALISVRTVTVRVGTAGLVTLVVAAQAGFDAHHGLPWRQAAITTNWATPAQYATMGTQLQHLVGGHAVQAGGEIGTLAYFCNCAIIDMFSDRAQLLPTITNITDHADPFTRRLINLNFHFLDQHVTSAYTEYSINHVPQPPTAGPAWPATSNWTAPGSPGNGYYTLTHTR